MDIGKNSDEGAEPALKTPKTRKPKVTKTAKSAQELTANIKCLTTHEKKSLDDDVEAATPHPLFTPAPIYLGQYKLPLPESLDK